MNEAISDRSVVDWIRLAGLPLTTVEPRSGFDDLQPLRAIVGDARVVSLGEATHGTREFRKLNHRIFEFCVSELGFTMLGIELPFSDSLAVNAYVLNGTGNAADALSGTRYWVWDTEEVLELVEWMRWWNANNSRKVKFYGFVTDYPASAALRLIDYLAGVAPDLAAECSTALAPLMSDFTARMFGQLAKALREEVFACIVKVCAAFTQERSRWAAATSDLDWHLGRLQAKVLDQAARFEVNRTYTSHDRVMAENVCALLKAEGPRANAVILSHNAHASRATCDDEKSMGGYLDEMLGRAQRVIGTSFDQGSFLARTYPTGELTNHNVSAATSASFDAVLAQTKQPLLALNLADAPCGGPIGAWITSEMPMRMIGGIYGVPSDNKWGITYANMIRPREQFDAVLFVSKTTATQPNRPSFPMPNPVILPAPSNLELYGDGSPTGWLIAGDRKFTQVALLPRRSSPRGGRTVCLSRYAPWRWGDGQLIQKISSHSCCGKRLRFAAAVRTETTEIGAGALLFVKFFRNGKESESEIFLEPLDIFASSGWAVRSQHWVSCEVEADVPKEAGSLVIGLIILGNGTAWFSDLEFTEIVSSD